MPARPFQPALQMPLFALATLLPLVLLVVGARAGGLWIAAGLLYMAALPHLLDRMSPALRDQAPEGAEFPAADALLIALALGHVLLLPLVCGAVARAGGLGAAERVALFAAAGFWFGQVAVPAAHELIHRGGRGLQGLGVLIYGTVLFGHHASAHRLVHHPLAASAQDPNTAPYGRSYYRFALRAWGGSFRQGWRAESELRRKAGRRGVHPYAVYLGLGLASLGLGWQIAGGAGVAVWAGLGLHAQSQLLLADYVQHYGLLRERRADGRLEPMGLRHSWNAPHRFSARLMLNAPHHSDHHAHPARPYPALRLPPPEEAPQLPFSLPVACMVALVPLLWRRIIHPRLAPWRRPADTGS